jgi:hypothetical protein
MLTPLNLRKPRPSTNARLLITAHATPAINRRRRTHRTITARLFKVCSIPIASIRDAVEELVVLRCAHHIDCDVEVPGLAEIVRRKRQQSDWWTLLCKKYAQAY